MADEDKVRWHLPGPLRISNPKVAQEAERMRKDLMARVNSPFAHLSPEEFEKGRAAARIEHLEHSIKQVETQLFGATGGNAIRQLREARNALLARLAENYATIGQYQLASLLHPDKAHREEYRKQVK